MTNPFFEYPSRQEVENHEVKMAKYHAKLDALRGVLIDLGGCESKESLEAIAENISAAFDKIKL